MEIRQVGAAERVDTMFPLRAYAFEGTGDLAAMLEAERRRTPYLETVTNLIAVEAAGEGREEAAACVAAYPMRQNVRGKPLDMAGVASVASHPGYRRRGYVRALIERLHRQMRDQGCAVSVLWPFRASFYARFGYVGLPQRRRVEFDPAGLPTVAEELGTVERRPLREVFDEYCALVGEMHAARHGFAVFDDVRTAEFRDTDAWVALARDRNRRTVGGCVYRISGFGGELQGGDLLSTGPLGRALLLGFFARHVDQVRSVKVSVAPDDVPELWGVDLPLTSTVRVALPDHGAPMARVLDVRGLDGIEVGPGAVTVEVVDDDLIAGVYRLESDNGRLRVEKGDEPQARLTAAGFGGLVYGVLDPVDVVARGIGEMTDEDRIRRFFPPKMPYVFSSF